MTKTYTSVYGQNWFDIALMCHGKLDHIYDIIRENGVDSINAPVPLFKEFKYDGELAEPAIVNEYKRKNIHVTTGIDNTIEAPGLGDFNNDFGADFS